MPRKTALQAWRARVDGDGFNEAAAHAAENRGGRAAGIQDAPRFNEAAAHAAENRRHGGSVSVVRDLELQ